MRAYGPIFSVGNAVILALFIAELIVRAAAEGFRRRRFLRDGWNLFDFMVVALSLLPGVGAFEKRGFEQHLAAVRAELDRLEALYRRRGRD